MKRTEADAGKLTELVGGKVTSAAKARLAAALRTLKRTESQGVREAVDFYLPELEAEARAIEQHRQQRRPRRPLDPLEQQALEQLRAHRKLTGK